MVFLFLNFCFVLFLLIILYYIKIQCLVKSERINKLLSYNELSGISRYQFIGRIIYHIKLFLFVNLFYP